ncbi:uncharacterized protein LOC106470505 [Limulus polyphemus]|uniref:Uncharacterized protein LOC106470505 n=1 Tax=Limulus polyphemus TaxID=6850 RepID=A0ABM1BQ54_LIMPO|nr:uncharacterized protein LOC106470505 [Limulus polyphemus]
MTKSQDPTSCRSHDCCTSAPVEKRITYYVSNPKSLTKLDPLNSKFVDVVHKLGQMDAGKLDLLDDGEYGFDGPPREALSPSAGLGIGGGYGRGYRGGYRGNFRGGYKGDFRGGFRGGLYFKGGGFPGGTPGGTGFPREQCDESKEFDCGDGTCVDKSLKCNGHFNCKYRYDEEDTICSVGSTASVVLSSEHMIIILVVFFALVFGMCLSISISCYNKIKERNEREREYRLRRSKEASMEIDLDNKISSLDKNEGLIMTPHTKMRSRKSNNKELQEAEGDGCHVPELDKYPNGGSSVNRAEDHSPRSPPTRQVAITILPDGSQHYPFCSYHRGSESPPLPPPPPPPLPPHLRRNREGTSEGLVIVDNQCPKHNTLHAQRVHGREVPSFPQEVRTEAVVELYPDSPGGCRQKYDHNT